MAIPETQVLTILIAEHRQSFHDHEMLLLDWLTTRIRENLGEVSPSLQAAADHLKAWKAAETWFKQYQEEHRESIAEHTLVAKKVEIEKRRQAALEKVNADFDKQIADAENPRW